MLTVRRSLSPAFLVAGLVVLSATAFGQDAAADQARASLQRGLALYKALDFKQAQAALLKVDRTALPAADKQTLDEYLGKVPDAIRKQAAAYEAYKQAVAALRNEQLDGAIQGFASAAASEYLNVSTRQDARAQLALAQKKKEVAAAARSTPPPVKPATTVKPPPKPAPKPAPTAKPAPKPSPKAQKMLDDAAARRAMAQRLLSLGKKALDERKADLAVQYFQRAKDLDPNLVEADQLLKAASKLVASRTASQAGILGRLQRRMLIAKQAAMVEINKYLERSGQALSGAGKISDFDNAEQAARGALETLNASKSFFSAREYRNESARIHDQLQLVAIRREAFNRKEAGRQAYQVEKMRADRLAEDDRKRREKIDTLTSQAKALRGQKRYSKALTVVNEILLIDPKSYWAAQEKAVLTEFDLLVNEGKSVGLQRRHEHRQFIDLRDSEIPWWEYVRFPKNWKQLTEDRKQFQASAAGESDADAALREKLRREIDRLSFNEIDFRDVVQFLREYSDTNIHVNWRALSTAGIEPTTKVSINLRRISVQRALDLVLRDVSAAAAGADADLRYVVEGGVLTISTKSDLAREPIRRVYDVRDLLVPVPDFKGPRIELTTASQQMQNQTSTSQGIFDDTTTDVSRREREEEEKTKEELTEDFVKLVRRAIDPESWSDPEAGGGGPGFIEALNGQLVVTQTAENHQALATLIEKLREAKTIQIAIEARFIVVDSGFLNSIGVDLDFYFNLGSSMRRADGPIITDPWTGNTIPTYVNTTGDVVSSFPAFTGSYWPGNKPGNDKWSAIGGKQNSSGFLTGIQTLVGSNIGLDVSDNGPALNIGGTFLDDIQVDFLVQATQAHVATRQLTAPRITLSNGQRSYITVARQQAYVREYIPVVSGNATAYRPIVAYIPTGAVLDVAATATADRRYVAMTVRPQVSNQEGDPTMILTDGGIIQLPTVTVQDLQTSVTVPDGGTLLLGGQKLSGESEREMGAPLLSKIPVINRMFTNRATVRDERTLLILVKPKIIINEAAERDENLYLEEPRRP